MFTGIIGVWLTTRENIWCWAISIFSVALYVYIFFVQKLYADSVLQFSYIFLSIYGWITWSNKPSNKSELPILNINVKISVYLLIVFVTLSIAISYYLKTFTDSPLPYTDAIFTSASVVCTWLMAKKYIENWLIWVVLDLGYIALFIYRQLYPTAFLYFIFTILAIKGFVDWKKTQKLQTYA